MLNNTKWYQSSKNQSSCTLGMLRKDLITTSQVVLCVVRVVALGSANQQRLLRGKTAAVEAVLLWSYGAKKSRLPKDAPSRLTPQFFHLETDEIQSSALWRHAIKSNPSFHLLEPQSTAMRSNTRSVPLIAFLILLGFRQGGTPSVVLSATAK